MNAAPGRRAVAGALIGLLAAAFFAVNGTVSKLVLDAGLSPLRLVEIRCAGAALVLMAVAALRSPASLRIRPRELGQIAVYGVVGIAMVQWLYLEAIERMPVSIALLIEFTAPLLVALWVRFGRRQPVLGRVWVALALSLAGLALVAEVWSGLTLDGAGLLAAGAAACALAVYYVLAEHHLGRRDPVSLAAWSFVAAGVFWSLLLPWWSFPRALLGDPVALPAGGTAPLWALVVWVVLLGTVLPFGLVLVAIGLIGSPRAGLIGTSEPVLAGAVAWVALGQVLGPVQLAGCAVVFAGIVLAVSARPEVVEPDVPVAAPIGAARRG